MEEGVPYEGCRGGEEESGCEEGVGEMGTSGEEHGRGGGEGRERMLNKVLLSTMRQYVSRRG